MKRILLGEDKEYMPASHMLYGRCFAAPFAFRYQLLKGQRDVSISDNVLVLVQTLQAILFVSSKHTLSLEPWLHSPLLLS